jgi:flagellar motor switch protein FliG
MESAFRGEVMLRMAHMEAVSPAVLETLVKSLLDRQHSAPARNYVRRDGAAFLTEIMKRFDRQSATAALEVLAKDEPELSASIRKGMFTFDDLGQLDQSTVTTILRDVDQSTLATAMKGCSENLRAMIFKGITKRAAEALEESLKFMTKVRRKDVEEARVKVMQVVFDLEHKGEITLAPEDSSAANS